MSEFDIFFDEYENKHNCSPEKYECFEAGQQSKQGEVYQLQAEIDELQKNFNNALKTIDIQQQFLDDTDGTIKIITSQVDELQNRIDELKMANHNLSVMTAEAESYSEYWKYELDKLQKRLDEINNHLEINYDENRDDDSHSYWSGYNQALRELFEILKGEETK